MTVGGKIKAFRELRNFSQQYMAEKLEMTASGYSKIELDKVKLSVEKLERIAGILDMEASKLMEFDDRIVFQNNTFENNKTIIMGNQGVSIHEYYQDKFKNLENRIEDLENSTTAKK